MVTILDYGINNLNSISRAVESLGHAYRVTTDLPADTERLIVPGVGAFGAAMEALGPLRDDIRAFADEGGPVMGICLGMQLLFDRSVELGEHEGLGLIPGRVDYLPPSPGLKIPHMGWSPLHYRQREALAEGGEEGEQVYFVHSLHAVPDDPETVLATATHGVEFTAAVRRGNVWGAQFHPEKSGAVGLRMLGRFLA